MQRTALGFMTSMVLLAASSLASAQPPAADPTMRVLDDPSDVAEVLDALEGRRAEAEGDTRVQPESGRRAGREAEDLAEGEHRAPPPADDQAVERHRRKLDEHDDERGESALDDDDLARDPAPVAPGGG